MNLNQPVFDNVLAIDAQLQKLQDEVAAMDLEFKNYKPEYNNTHRPRERKDVSSPEITEEASAPKKAVSFSTKSITKSQRTPAARPVVNCQ